MEFGYRITIDTWLALMTYHRNYQWLHSLITDDEKCEEASMTGNRYRNDLHPRKIMLSVWWGVRAITHWEVLPNRFNTTADLYCQQLNHVAAKFQRMQDRVYFLHDNARSHLAKSTGEKLLKVGWTTIPHPVYSPDLAPTDYHLYRSLSDYLRETVRTT